MMGSNFRVKQQQKNLPVTFLDASSKETVIPTVLIGFCLCAAGRIATKWLVSLCVLLGKGRSSPFPCLHMQNQSQTPTKHFLKCDIKIEARVCLSFLSSLLSF